MVACQWIINWPSKKCPWSSPRLKIKRAFASLIVRQNKFYKKLRHPTYYLNKYFHACIISSCFLLGFELIRPALHTDHLALDQHFPKPITHQRICLIFRTKFNIVTTGQRTGQNHQIKTSHCNEKTNQSPESHRKKSDSYKSSENVFVHFSPIFDSCRTISIQSDQNWLFHNPPGGLS